MVSLVDRVSGGETLCDWIYQSRDEPRSLGAISKIPADRFHQRFHEAAILLAPRNHPKIPDIFSDAPVSPLNSTLYTGRTLYCYSLFHVLVNKLFELKEVIIPFLLLLALELNAILTQY